MAYSLSPWLKPRFFITGTNRPLAGGLLYTYKAGTTTNATTYSDDAGTPNTNPIVLDSDGQCNLYLDDAVSYRFILKNSAGVTQFDKDRVASLGNRQVQSFDSIASLRLKSGTTQANAAKTLGYYSPGDGGGNSFYWSSTSTATDNGGTVIKPTSVSGAGRWLAVDTTYINAKQFGAKGDSINDDTSFLSEFFANANNKQCEIPSGTYKTTSLISTALSNCRIYGTEGSTTIVGSFGYAILRLLALSNVSFYGIKFQTDYVNAVEDLGTSVVYSFQNNVTNVDFRRCKFSSPSANTSALTIYARVNAGDTSGTIDGLWIEDCDFVDVGRIAVTIMNRNTNAFTAAQRVYFNRNKGKNLGTQGSFGFLVSFDGYGQHFTCNDNLINDALGIGIENINWRNGEFRGNRFYNFVKVSAPMSFSGTMTGLVIEDNRTMGAANSRSNFIGVSNSRFRGNYFEATGDYAFSMRAGSNNLFEGDTYKSNNIYAALIGLTGVTTAGNQWRNCTFDTSSSAANTSVVRFDGSATTRNVVSGGLILKGTGGSITDQTNSAVGNFVDDFIDAAGLTPSNYLTVSMSDADYTFSSQNQTIRYNNFRFNGTLTADRTVTFPDGATNFYVWNNTAYALTVKPLSGSGFVVFPNQRVFVASNGTNFVGTGSFASSWNSSQGIIALGNYRLWVDGTGGLRIKLGAPTSDTDGTIVGTQY